MNIQKHIENNNRTIENLWLSVEDIVKHKDSQHVMNLMKRIQEIQRENELLSVMVNEKSIEYPVSKFNEGDHVQYIGDNLIIETSDTIKRVRYYNGHFRYKCFGTFINEKDLKLYSE